MPLRSVLRALRDHGPQPRIELARRLSVSPTTVTKVVARLLDRGVVTETGVDAPGLRLGRPRVHVALVPTAAYVIGVQVGVGVVRLGLCDLLGQPRRTTRFDFDVAGTDATVVLGRLAARLGKLMAEAGVTREEVLGVGVAAPGPVDPHRRRNLLSVNLGWRDVAFSDHLEHTLGLPTVVDHNVRAMAVGEARHGGHPDADPLLYVYVRTGVGAGVVIDGKPFRSGGYGVAELGHLRVSDSGRICACGAEGCLETVVSEPRLAERLAALGNPADAPLRRLAGLAAAGDLGAEAVVEDLVEHLAMGLAFAVNLLNPRLIVLGGMFEDAPAALITRVEEAVRRKAFPVLRDVVRVGRSTLRDGGVIGGATVALDHFFYT
ncbi:ROK family transcriptional regulator [Acrocarpospora sp. B8E8]|uniref:ROK family transcriptional regulator n=1 Tax=Acrocarpospora sp. B8E8 TaxID=3153572 RepID=UPI00325CF1E3